MHKSLKLLLTLAVGGLAGALLWGLLPGRGFDTNLGRIGQGQPALVLAFENYAPAGSESMALLDKVRDDYAQRVEFLVADLGTPAGRTFAGRHGLRDGMVILLDGGGRPLEGGLLPDSESALRASLDRHLGR